MRASRRITAIDDWAATAATGPFGTGSFVYDALGNIRVKTLGTQQVELQYNGNNQLSSVRITDHGVAGAWQTYAYADGRGNVTHNGRLGFTYDRAEQPVTMTGQASGAFVYDGNLKRVKQTVNGRTVYSVYGRQTAGTPRATAPCRRCRWPAPASPGDRGGRTGVRALRNGRTHQRTGLDRAHFPEQMIGWVLD